VRDKASQANEAVLLVRGIKQQIADRRTKLGEKAANVKRTLDEFENGDRQLLYYDYDLHWTAEGHLLAARSVAKFLVEERLP